MINEFSYLKHILLYLKSFIKNESNKMLKNNRKVYRMCVGVGVWVSAYIRIYECSNIFIYIDLNTEQFFRLYN